MNFLDKTHEDKRLVLYPTSTTSGLPVLTRTVKNAFIEEIDRDISFGKCPRDILKERYKKIYRENRLVLESIREILCYFPPCDQFNVAIALTDIYSLLDSQGNRDKIWEYFSKPAN